ncbi:MAG: energy transducer TonB [Oceanospirillaceae bacterium]|nr:energy transducer TonB [Oceanospirillaceae bacterium]
MNGNSGFQALGRLLFTLILAAGLHTVFLLGIPADPVLPPPASSTLQIHLAPQVSAHTPAPETTVETAPAPLPPVANVSPSPAPIHKAAPQIKPEAKLELKPAPAVKTTAPTNIKTATKRVTTTQPVTPPAPAPVKKAVLPKPATLTKKPSSIAETKAEPPKPTISASSLLARSLSMARETPLDMLDPAPVGQRTKRLQASRYNSALENSYLMHWREKVQRIGALNYPESARRQKLSGQLRLLVTLNADGTLDEVAILSSSEYPELDQAAIRIVQLSAPFRPFPVEMRKTTDRLEIIRVWKFENDTVVY